MNKEWLYEYGIQILLFIIIFILLCIAIYFYPHINESSSDDSSGQQEYVTISKQKLDRLYSDLEMYKDLCHRMQLTIREMWGIEIER